MCAEISLRNESNMNPSSESELFDELIKFEYEFVVGSKKNSTFLYLTEEKHLFRKKESYKGTFTYQCVEKTCKSRVCITSTGQCVKSKKYQDHNHGSNEQKKQEFQVINNIKEEFMKPNNVSLKPKKIFDMNIVSNQGPSKLLNYGNMRRHLQRLQEDKLVKKQPKNVAEINEAFAEKTTMEHFGMTMADQKRSFFKVAFEDPEFSYCIFASDEIIDLIKNSIAVERRRYLMDATFKIVPKTCFRQFLIIYIEYLEKVFPFIYILMTNKSTKAYESVFGYIKQNIFDMDGYSFMTDYEAAMRNALKNVFPQSKFFACWFHYCQAVRKKCEQDMNLKNFIKTNERINKIYHKFLCLPLLPAKDIVEAFNIIKLEINCLSKKNIFEDFIKYFQKQWLQRETPETISVFDCMTRTTSSLEAYNGVLGRIIHAKGGFYKFICSIREEEFSKARDFGMLIDSGRLSASQSGTRKKQKDRHDKIIEAVDKYTKKEIILIEFLNRLTYSKNKIIYKMDEFIDTNNDVDTESTDEEETLDSTSIPTTSSGNLGMLCNICLIDPPNIIFFPCSHVKLCKNCYNILNDQAVADNTKPICPICRSTIEQAMTAFI